MALRLWCFVGLFAQTQARHKLVMYWGCDNPLNAGHSGFKDQPLDQFCDRGTYDIVQLAFLDSFVDGRTNQPHMHLHKHHCNTTFKSTDPDPDVGLIHCPYVANQIKHCQSKGVRVGVSLGGGVGNYYFTSDEQAQQFAHKLWNMFFVPDGKELRPFDDAVLDGIDLDIEGGTGLYYGTFLKEFHSIVQGYKEKEIFIAGAPQCTAAAEGHIGFMWNIIEPNAQYFSHMWPQFYNNYCYYPSQYNGWYSDTVRSALGAGPSPPPIPMPPPTPVPPTPPPHPDCHSISPHATDEWCMKNCHWTPPNCPETLCKCDDDLDELGEFVL